MYKWRLRTSLIFLLGITSTVTFLVIGSLLLLLRIPQVTQETREQLILESQQLAKLTEERLSGLQVRLQMLATLLAATSPDKHQSIIEQATDSSLMALYEVGASGKIRHVAANKSIEKSHFGELIGNDLTGDPLYQKARSSNEATWGEKQLSRISNRVTVSLALPSKTSVLIAEIPIDFILNIAMLSSRHNHHSGWVLDRHGEILADSEDATRVGVTSMAHLPMFSGKPWDDSLNLEIDLENRKFDAAAAHSARLDWYFVVRSPSGRENPAISNTIDLGMATLGGSLLLGLLLAPLWATQMARPLRAITRRTRDFAEGKYNSAWPRSKVLELDQLSIDLENMATVITEREQELEAIFGASPVGICVLDPAADYAFLKLNDALLQLIGYSREEAVGKPGGTLKLWVDPTLRAKLYATLEHEGHAKTEGWLRRKDGNLVLAAISARTVDIGGRPRTIWAATDITATRRIEDEIRRLNGELEERVAQRTEQLHDANIELSNSVERLQFAQTELVRSEKLASLGAMVAGIAHELNTPIGNGMMAISTLRNAIDTFHAKSAEGMRRSVLDNFVESVDTGIDIAQRNIERAAELVASFKQVAADQTSSQRRDFLLREMAEEIALTLQPMLRKTAATLHLDIPPAISMQSYPGPLGQVLTNLIANAAFHAFTPDQTGSIHLSARQTNNDHVLITVEDDGCGIPETLLPRIFDPFVTSKMGRGGTGLGLHIVHNIAFQVLGGKISARSTEGAGTCFELVLPLTAPMTRSTQDSGQIP